jgi:WD40 repeat protein
LWDVATLQEIRTIDANVSAPFVVFAPDGRTALSGSGDNTLKLWNLPTLH